MSEAAPVWAPTPLPTSRTRAEVHAFFPHLAVEDLNDEHEGSELDDILSGRFNPDELHQLYPYATEEISPRMCRGGTSAQGRPLFRRRSDIELFPDMLHFVACWTQYTGIVSFVVTSDPLGAALNIYLGNILYLNELYEYEDVLKYHFAFQKRNRCNYDPDVWRTIDNELVAELLEPNRR